MEYARELSEALTAARLAGDYAMKEYVSFVPIPNAPASISTHVDHGAQELILKHLRAAFPGDGLVAEERTPTLADAPTGADRVWVVDPI
ncbi:MAG TPA: inositol monophosphatase family protein, partial [Fimbriiglobus sp.]|nr:inositol monophosphatase family protein [Fimbriiglobus sp.]